MHCDRCCWECLQARSFGPPHFWGNKRHACQHNQTCQHNPSHVRVTKKWKYIKVSNSFPRIYYCEQNLLYLVLMFSQIVVEIYKLVTRCKHTSNSSPPPQIQMADEIHLSKWSLIPAKSLRNWQTHCWLGRAKSGAAGIWSSGKLEMDCWLSYARGLMSDMTTSGNCCASYLHEIWYRTIQHELRLRICLLLCSDIFSSNAPSASKSKTVSVGDSYCCCTHLTRRRYSSALDGGPLSKLGVPDTGSARYIPYCRRSWAASLSSSSFSQISPYVS